MLVQLRQHLLEIAVEKVDTQLDVLDVAQEKLYEEFLVDEVGEADECATLLTVHKKGAGQKAHVLVHKSLEQITGV